MEHIRLLVEVAHLDEVGWKIVEFKIALYKNMMEAVSVIVTLTIATSMLKVRSYCSSHNSPTIK